MWNLHLQCYQVITPTACSNLYGYDDSWVLQQSPHSAKSSGLQLARASECTYCQQTWKIWPLMSTVVGYLLSRPALSTIFLSFFAFKMRSHNRRCAASFWFSFNVLFSGGGRTPTTTSSSETKPWARDAMSGVTWVETAFSRSSNAMSRFPVSALMGGGFPRVHGASLRRGRGREEKDLRRTYRMRGESLSFSYSSDSFTASRIIDS